MSGEVNKGFKWLAKVCNFLVKKEMGFLKKPIYFVSLISASCQYLSVLLL